MVIPNNAQQIAACIRPVTAAKVIAVDSAKQHELIHDLKAETRGFGPAHPVHDPRMRYVRSELTDALCGAAPHEERAEKPGRLWRVDRIKSLVGVDDTPEHVVDADIALHGLNHCNETVPRPNIVAVQEREIPPARKLDAVIYRGSNTESRLRGHQRRRSMFASSVGGIIRRSIVDDDRLKIGEPLRRDAVQSLVEKRLAVPNANDHRHEGLLGHLGSLQ
jgi:hypothetical protein